MLLTFCGHLYLCGHLSSIYKLDLFVQVVELLTDTSYKMHSAKCENHDALHNHEEIGKRAANILVDRFLNQLVTTQLILRVSTPKPLSSMVPLYVRKLFNPDILPSHHRFYTFLKTALDLTSAETLYPLLLPRVIVQCTRVVS